MKELSWKPKRQGHVYCSPACRCGCLYESYVDRKRMADKLAADLGEGWRPRVWENMGWHAGADFGGTLDKPLMSIHIRKGLIGRRGYTMIVELGRSNAAMHGASPERLISAAVSRIHKERDRLEKMLREAFEAIGPITRKAVARRHAPTGRRPTEPNLQNIPIRRKSGGRKFVPGTAQ